MTIHSVSRALIFGWALLSICSATLLVKQSLVIGGAQYLVHVGFGWPAFVEALLAISGVAIAFGLSGRKTWAFDLAKVVAWGLYVTTLPAMFIVGGIIFVTGGWAFQTALLFIPLLMLMKFARANIYGLPKT